MYGRGHMERSGYSATSVTDLSTKTADISTSAPLSYSTEYKPLGRRPNGHTRSSRGRKGYFTII